MPTSKRSRWLGADLSEGVERVRALPYDETIPDLTAYSPLVRALDEHWGKLEAPWKVSSRPEYARLVIPSGNATAPIHRWFHFKEAYSKDLLQTLLANELTSISSMTLVDPFAGVGTTLLSAVEATSGLSNFRLTAFGIEVNPFLHFVTSTKLAAATGRLTATFEDLQQIVRAAEAIEDNSARAPQLSTFQNDEYFPSRHVQQLAKLRKAISQLDQSSDLVPLARMALAMTVEPASRLRRDGRALRYEERDPAPPFDVFERAAQRIVSDLPTATADRRSTITEVTLQSAVAPWDQVPIAGCDVIVFSPPYPNNIDYTEVYKTELWALGFVGTREDFRAQRHETLRSHPSVKFTRELSYRHSEKEEADVNELIGPLIAAIPSESRYANALQAMIRGYTDDMLTTMKSAFAALRPGGRCIYVVGNSVHGTKTDPVMIASDLIIARVGEMVGFEVEELRVARALPRRKIDSPYVRETIGILRRPAT
jgi:hypothetical protein